LPYNLFMPTLPPARTGKKTPSPSPHPDRLPGGAGKKSYFGLSGLIIGIISGLFLAANFGSAYLNITPATFSQLNIMTAFLYCILAPLALILAVIGALRKHDSRQYSLIAIVVVLLPFFGLMIEFFHSMKSGAFTIQ
jgi:hypothetical protein